MKTYGDFPGVKVEVSSQNDLTPGMGYPRDYEELYARVSVGTDGQVIMTPQPGEHFGSFGDHQISFVKGDEHFAASCCHCGHRMVAPLDRVQEAGDDSRRCLRHYMAGFFLDTDCDMKATEAVERVAEKYLGKTATHEEKMNLNTDAQVAIHKVACEEGRVTHLG